jgi:hypothetical protein
MHPKKSMMVHIVISLSAIPMWCCAMMPPMNFSWQYVLENPKKTMFGSWVGAQMRARLLSKALPVTLPEALV